MRVTLRNTNIENDGTCTYQDNREGMRSVGDKGPCYMLNGERIYGGIEEAAKANGRILAYLYLSEAILISSYPM